MRSGGVSAALAALAALARPAALQRRASAKRGGRNVRRQSRRVSVRARSSGHAVAPDSAGLERASAAGFRRARVFLRWSIRAFPLPRPRLARSTEPRIAQLGRAARITTTHRNRGWSACASRPPPRVPGALAWCAALGLPLSDEDTLFRRLGFSRRLFSGCAVRSAPLPGRCDVAGSGAAAVVDV